MRLKELKGDYPIYLSLLRYPKYVSPTLFPLKIPAFKGVSDLIDLSEHHLALSWPEVLIPAQPQAASAVLTPWWLGRSLPNLATHGAIFARNRVPARNADHT